MLIGGCLLSRAGKGAPALAEEDSDEEEEPAFELPEELKEWSGDPSDRKGMLLFRQEQQAARQVPQPSLPLSS